MSDPKQMISDLPYVSHETLARLGVYADALEKWNPSINLVAKSTLPDKWRRHFLDSVQLFELAPDDVANWGDIGSGAGFPGLVLAIVYAQVNPSVTFTLVESDARKCAFLRNTARAVDININVVTQRIETVDNFQVDVLSARALAPLDQLLRYSANILRPGGTCLFLKGQSCDKELEQAAANFRFDVEKKPSQTADNAWMVKLTGISAK